MDEPHDPSRTARAAVVLRPGEHRCEVSFGEETALVGYSAPFGTRATSLTPGHLVAVAEGPAATYLLIWRWYDAVVVEQTADQVRLWEPNHGEVLAQSRDARYVYPVGTRAYASAGLPGADWWVEGQAGAVGDAEVAMDQVHEFYTAHGLWSRLADR